MSQNLFGSVTNGKGRSRLDRLKRALVVRRGHRDKPNLESDLKRANLVGCGISPRDSRWETHERNVTQRRWMTWSSWRKPGEQVDGWFRLRYVNARRVVCSRITVVNHSFTTVWRFCEYLNNLQINSSQKNSHTCCSIWCKTYQNFSAIYWVSKT